jgi:pescadillo
MARAPKKPGKSGHAVNYMTRQQALKKLQVSLADFRRLCILKGVYPRDPSKKVKGKDKTYYATKDILFLLHEPVLEKVREIKTHLKKLTTARARRDEFRVKILERTRPFYLLDHLVKERFPTFTDAVRDMDDALSMVTLYAHLPSTDKIKSERTRNCKRLCLEFNNWVVREHALQKVFLSIKGCYFQAQIQGQSVTWLVPYEFSQELPDDVDYKVMRTFLEFYETHLHFINFRLYSASGLIYPPKLDAKLDAVDAGLSSYRLESKDAPAAAGPAAAAGRAKKDPRLRALEGKLDTLERTPGAAPEASGPAAVEEDLNALINPDGDEDGAAATAAAGDDKPLFDGLRIFVSREVSRHIFEFVARALGARVGWEGEGSPFSESDESITHQVRRGPWTRDAIIIAPIIVSMRVGLLYSKTYNEGGARASPTR